MAEKMIIPLLAIAAWSGTGKTTLLKKLIPELCVKGIRPGLIKHTHHNMDIDKPGKDSYELRKAGAAQTLVASQQRWALDGNTGRKGIRPVLAGKPYGCVHLRYSIGRRF